MSMFLNQGPLTGKIFRVGRVRELAVVAGYKTRCSKAVSVFLAFVVFFSPSGVASAAGATEVSSAAEAGPSAPDEASRSLLPEWVENSMWLPASRLAASAPWPTTDWSASLPLEQGMLPSRLLDGFEYAINRKSTAVLVIRNGYLVAEWYADGWNRSTQQNGFSITKSMTGAIIGMLIDDGLIAGKQQPVAEFVPAWRGMPNEQITIANLLSMDSGLQWDYWTDVRLLPLAPNQNLFAIDTALESVPGSSWRYHNSAAQVLSEVIKTVTGMQPEAYARQELWNRIGMHNTWLLTDETGNSLTWKGLIVSARELAKFGYLYLREGEWDGEQVISRNWVMDSIKPSQNLNPFFGYLWWLNTDRLKWPDVPADAFAARGAWGRSLFVVPSLDLIVVRLGDKDPSWSDNAFLGKIVASVPERGLCNPPVFGAQNYAVGEGPRFVATGDLNNDGHTDLAVANVYSDDISILINDGHAGFGNQLRYPVGDGPRSIAISDLDIDGDLDLVVANGASSDILILFNRGDGTFTAGMRYRVGDLPTTVKSADLDGDNFPDLAVANFAWPFSASNYLSVLINAGGGIFGPEARYQVGEAPHDVEIADVNNDGYQDLVSANAASADVSVLLNLGDGSFANQARYTVGNGPSEVAVRDINADAMPDIVVTNFWSVVSAVGEEPEGDVSVLLNNGDGGFTTETRYSTGNGPVAIDSGDLNGDGSPDLGVANYWSNDLSLLLNNGDGTFGAEIRYGSQGGYLSGQLPHSIIMHDLNGDGGLEVVVSWVGSNDIAVLRNYCLGAR